MDLLKRTLSAGACYRAARMWSWPGVSAEMDVIAVSHFGDLFLEGRDGVWYLDLPAGTLSHEWPSRSGLFDVLGDRRVQGRFLRADVLRAVLEAGRRIEPSRILVPAVPPVLGGALEPEGLHLQSLEAAHRFFSQVHEQVRRLPASAAVYGVMTDASGRVSLETGAVDADVVGQSPPHSSHAVRHALADAMARRYGRAPGFATPSHDVSILRPPEGIAALRIQDHWHLVTCGLAAAGKVTHGTAELFELSLKVPAREAEHQPPSWALLVLTQVCDRLRRSDGSISAGHAVLLPTLDDGRWVRPWPAYTLVPDAALGPVATPLGPVRLLQVVSLSQKAYDDYTSASGVRSESAPLTEHPNDPSLLSPPLLPLDAVAANFSWTPPGETASDARATATVDDASSDRLAAAGFGDGLCDEVVDPTDGARIVRMWTWVPEVTEDMRVIGTSRFGDLFLESSGGVSYLDITSGTVAATWATIDAMRSGAPDGQEQYLRASAVRAAVDRGVELAAGCVLVPALPPVLGGSLDMNEIEATPLVPAQAFASQLHQQIAQLAPGTPIYGVNVDGVQA